MGGTAGDGLDHQSAAHVAGLPLDGQARSWVAGRWGSLLPTPARWLPCRESSRVAVDGRGAHGKALWLQSLAGGEALSRTLPLVPAGPGLPARAVASGRCAALASGDRSPGASGPGLRNDGRTGGTGGPRLSGGRLAHGREPGWRGPGGIRTTRTSGRVRLRLRAAGPAPPRAGPSRLSRRDAGWSRGAARGAGVAGRSGRGARRSPGGRDVRSCSGLAAPQRADLPLAEVHPWPWLVRPHAGPAGSFTAWRTAARVW